MYCATAAAGAHFACEEFADGENFDSTDVPAFSYEHGGDAMSVDQAYEYSAPKFIDLSTLGGCNVSDDDGTSNDDHWFERVHPLHESRRPRKPLRSLLTGSPTDVKASPAPSNDDMDRDDAEVGDDSSQRKRQRSWSCEPGSHAKRRLQQTGGPRHGSDGTSNMNLGEDDASEDGDGDHDEILAMIASHNAVKLCTGGEAQRRAQLAGANYPTSKTSRQAPPSSSNTQVGLTPRDGNLRRPHGPTRSARKRHSRSRQPGDENDHANEAEISALIAAHNQKFRPKCDYAPPQHSVRDVKAWEAETGNRWYQLSPNSRLAANEAISQMKGAMRT